MKQGEISLCSFRRMPPGSLCIPSPDIYLSSGVTIDGYKRVIEVKVSRIVNKDPYIKPSSGSSETKI